MATTMETKPEGCVYGVKKCGCVVAICVSHGESLIEAVSAWHSIGLDVRTGILTEAVAALQKCTHPDEPEDEEDA